MTGNWSFPASIAGPDKDPFPGKEHLPGKDPFPGKDHSPGKCRSPGKCCRPGYLTILPPRRLSGTKRSRAGICTFGSVVRSITASSGTILLRARMYATSE